MFFYFKKIRNLIPTNFLNFKIFLGKKNRLRESIILSSPNQLLVSYLIFLDYGMYMNLLNDFFLK